ncbi:MAG TPA: gas vesicle protein GvpH [Vicinamibacterales bacterium]|jgi:hypothetical protein
MVRYAFAIGLASLAGYGLVPAKQAQCGSAPSAEQIARRRAGITTARQINTAEARSSAAGGKYVPLALLKGVTVPDGFDVQVSTDGEGYTFSVKDAKDECHPAFFSDQTGLIYTGTPLQ